MAIVCTIDETGIHAPSLADIQTWLTAQFQSIYGEDAYLEPDGPDGQWLGIVSTAMHDQNAVAVAVYNSFSPSSAQGVGLSRVVKINGIQRAAPSNSSADLLLGGTVGTTITNGYATDAAGERWMLPEVVVIPPDGQITVTATAANTGSISAGAGMISGIGTPTRGWQTVTNPAAATEGEPVEGDATLRRRQAVSTAIPSLSILDGLLGNILGLSGVSRARAYENDTSATDANGIPSHSLSMVVDGGDANTIAQTILNKKGPGAGTYGTTTETVEDAYGIGRDIHFFRPTMVPISVAVSIEALAGYTSAIGDNIKSAIATYINALGIGDDVLVTRLYVPANLNGGTNSETFDLTSLAIARDTGSPVPANVALAFNEAATCSVDDITLTVG